MPNFAIKRNDRLPALRVQLLRDDGTIVNLTTATAVTLKMGAPFNLNVAAVVIDAVNGIVEYAWAAGNTNVTEGNYRAEFEVTWPGGIPETFPTDGYIIVQVYTDLG